MKKNSQALNEINTQFKLQIEELWKDFILPKWNIYGNYILTKLKKKNKNRKRCNSKIYKEASKQEYTKI